MRSSAGRRSLSFDSDCRNSFFPVFMRAGSERRILLTTGLYLCFGRGLAHANRGLFLEHIHPNHAGHRVLAAALLARLAERHRLGPLQAPPAEVEP